MTVSSETNKVTYSGDGATVAFSTSFTFAANAEVTVTHIDSSNTRTEWTEGTQYTLSGAGTGNAGTVTVDTSPTDYTPAAGETLLIQLKPDYTQTTALPRGGTVSPKDTLEPMHDSRVRQMLRLKDDLDRAVKVPIEETTPGADLPVASSRANKYFAFDSNGYPTVSDAAALPSSLTGNGLNMIRVNSGATAYEFRTPAQVFTALLATEGNGVIAHTGSGAAEPRTITGTSAEITVSDGDGVSGNPTLSLPTALTFTGKTITGGTYSSMAVASTMAGDPTTALQIATKQYVDSVAAGLSTRYTVVCTDTGSNVAIASELENGDTLDGVTLSTGDEVLLRNQTATEENGIYTVVASGAASRSTEFDAYDDHPGTLITTQEGSTNGDKLYLCTSNTGGTIDVTAITYTNIVPGSGGTVTSVATGTGLTGGTITGSGTVSVAAGGIDTTQLADDGVTPAKVSGSVNAQTGTTYTLVIGDAFKTITMSNASANTLTIPTNASVAFSTGDRIDIWMKGAGATTVTGDTGVTLNGVSAGGGAISAQYSAVSIVKIGTDEWLMSGNHAAVA